MKKLFLLCFLSLNLTIFSQIEYVEWNTETQPLEKQKLYYKTGNIKLENLILNDTLFRIEYFESGEIKLKAQITQSINDTIWQINAITLEDEMLIVDYTNEITNGIFKEFYETGNLKTTGKLVRDNKYDIWNYYYEDGSQYKIMTFDKIGHKKEYLEYFRNGNVKIKGQYVFERIETIETVINSITLEKFEINRIDENELKTGVWKYYYPNGKLKEKIKYKN